jgi:hypothetical protein
MTSCVMDGLLLKHCNRGIVVGKYALIILSMFRRALSIKQHDRSLAAVYQSD